MQISDLRGRLVHRKSVTTEINDGFDMVVGIRVIASEEGKGDRIVF